MRRRLLISILLAAVLVGATAARGEIFRTGNLQVAFDGGFTPRSLPRDRLVPVRVRIDGSITTTDGTRPPPLRRFNIALNGDGRLSTRGLSTCASPSLQSTTSEAALERCGPALVGRGHFKADLEFGTTGLPAKGRMLAFNSRRGGKPALLLHLYGTVPVRATFVLPLAIARRSEGQLGTLLSAKIPTLAGGQGSITDIDLELGREYTYRGQRLSFISASCAAPAGFDLAIFTFARGSFSFAGGRTLSTTLTRECWVR